MKLYKEAGVSPFGAFYLMRRRVFQRGPARM